MDIERSQRLVKFANLIKDMVDYMEISEYLLQCGTLSQTDHARLSHCVQHRGNPFAMEDLIHILGLRRGGFNAFIGALKANDYIWLADQMEFQSKDFTDSSKGIFPSIANNLKRRKSRKSERMSSETIFASYRQSVPIELNTIRRTDSQSIPSSSLTSKFLSFPAKFISASLDNLKLVDSIGKQETELAKATSTRFLGSESPMTESSDEDHDGDNVTTTFGQGSSKSKPKSNYAIIYNVPEPSKAQVDAPSNVKIVSKIAEQLKFPEEYLKGLKAVRVGRVSKDKPVRPLKVKFKSVEARNQFISVLKSQAPDSILSQLEVVPYVSESKSTVKKPEDMKPPKGRWYQRRFLALKRTKQPKAP